MKLKYNQFYIVKTKTFNSSLFVCSLIDTNPIDTYKSWICIDFPKAERYIFLKGINYNTIESLNTLNILKNMKPLDENIWKNIKQYFGYYGEFSNVWM